LGYQIEGLEKAMVVQEDKKIHDRRILQRFNLRLEAVLKELHERERALELYTRDISSDGAFFYTDSPLPVDSNVELTLFLPPGDPKKSKIKVDGKVIRTEPNGIAVRFDSRYTFTPV
jgi:hypothetical protein